LHCLPHSHPEPGKDELKALPRNPDEAVDFDYTHFGPIFYFRGFLCPRLATFGSATFSQDTELDRATFAGYADFSEVTFANYSNANDVFL
jgi:hypothetical protein